MGEPSDPNKVRLCHFTGSTSNPIVINEVKVVGSRCGDMKRAVEMLASGGVDPMALVEARYPLARADEALAHAGRRGAMKVLVDVAAEGRA